MSDHFSRRRFLSGLAAAGAAVSVPGIAAAGAAAGKPFRFAHLTDPHCMADRRADEGLAACLKAVEEMKPRPDFILTGGDLVNDVLAADDF